MICYLFLKFLQANISEKRRAFKNLASHGSRFQQLKPGRVFFTARTIPYERSTHLDVGP
jgi:hypothetical protein